MSRIVITEFMDERAVARLRAAHDLLYDPRLVDEPAQLLAQVHGAHALIVRNRTQVRGELLAALERGTVVGRLGVGLDNIDVPACDARGLRVIAAGGANAASVAEYVITAALLLLRGAYGSSGEVVAGRWPRNILGNGRELGGKTVGLVGFGSIGRLTARLAGVFGTRLIAYDALMADDDPAFADHGVARVSLDELVDKADVVSLHLPLTHSTRWLFDEARIAAMKPDAVLVNTSRGGIVDEFAVTQALRAGRLGGAALDVFEDEPLAWQYHFEGCPNLLLTPHIAGVTRESNERVSNLIADRVLEALR